ncbi:MAG: VOC family protein [Gemmatimonadaceae bacterium]
MASSTTTTPKSTARADEKPSRTETIPGLAEFEAVATVAVRNIDAARKFYEQTLGLRPTPGQEQGVVSYRSGKSSVFVYQSQFAGTNKATAATWNVDGVEKVVADLKKKGVAFEHYDFPGLTRKGDVHVAAKFKTAWFKDPDGNILAIVGQ